MKRSKGTLSKHTRCLKATKKYTVTDMLKKFEVNEHVVIAPVLKYNGHPHPRFRGLHGKIIALRGKSYEVEIVDGNKKKIIIVPPIHLQKI